MSLHSEYFLITFLLQTVCRQDMFWANVFLNRLPSYTSIWKRKLFTLSLQYHYKFLTLIQRIGHLKRPRLFIVSSELVLDNRMLVCCVASTSSMRQNESGMSGLEDIEWSWYYDYQIADLSRFWNFCFLKIFRNFWIFSKFLSLTNCSLTSFCRL